MLTQLQSYAAAADATADLLERTREIARKTGAFDWKKLPKELQVAVDSSPTEGARPLYFIVEGLNNWLPF